jgi:lipopolysaccharide heptosyltransferase II
LRILLVRLRLIGDVVFTTPLVAALRARFPDAHLTYLVEQSAAPVVAASPHVSEVVTVAYSRGWRRLADDVRLARRLRAGAFDLAIDLHGGPRSAWLTWASRARVRVGYDVPGRSWMYTRVVPRPRTYRPRHAVENQWDLVAAVDGVFATAPSRETNPVEMWPSADDHRTAAAFLAEAAVGATAELVIVHVSAGNPFRRWPESSFSALAGQLARDHPNRVVLVTAGPSDREAAARVVAAARDRAGMGAGRVLLGDALSLGQLRALCDRAALFVGGDSGPLHVASTSRVPIVGIYGPTLPERSSPWRPTALPTAAVEPGTLDCRPCDQRRCVPGDYRCLTGVPVEAVAGAAARLLEART